MFHCSAVRGLTETSGADTSGGHTRSHPEHDGTPVPIPNTMVKTRAADGTMLETAWESRRVPDDFNDLINDLRRKNFSFQMADQTAVRTLKTAYRKDIRQIMRSAAVPIRQPQMTHACVQAAVDDGWGADIRRISANERTCSRVHGCGVNSRSVNKTSEQDIREKTTFKQFKSKTYMQRYAWYVGEAKKSAGWMPWH